MLLAIQLRYHFSPTVKYTDTLIFLVIASHAENTE